jgi:hypothetical protein
LLVRAYDRLVFLQHRYQQSVDAGETEQAADLMAQIRWLHPKTAEEIEQANWHRS